jgi:DNA-binding MarR family transcriptional regulator
MLAEFRHLLRRFLEFSGTAARAAKLTPQQHQALLAVTGWRGSHAMRVGDLADRLLLRHHSATELVKRLAARGLLEGRRDPEDRRRVLLRVTAAGERRLAKLSAVHLEELNRIEPALSGMLALLRGRRKTVTSLAERTPEVPRAPARRGARRRG